MGNRRVTVWMAASVVAGAALAAPEEDALGRASGYPAGTVQSMFENKYMVGSFSAADRLFTTRVVAKEGPTWALPQATEVPKITYQYEGKTLTLDDYLDRQRVTSLLIVKNGQLLVERYQYGRTAEDKLMSFSMAKSVTGLLVGQALERGLIKSLDDTAQTYAPELKDSVYGPVSIRHLLRMASGAQWAENHGGRDDVSGLWGALFRVHRGGNPTTELTAGRRQVNPPGQKFNYSTGDTQVLCHVLKGATGKTIAEITEEWLWKPLGAGADASWLVGWQGLEYCGGGFNATARDYARLGMLVARDGERDGKQIVPKDYLLDATDHERQPPGFRLNDIGPNTAYGYQFWLGRTGGRGIAMIGVYGQYIGIVPSTGVVVVHTAVWPSASVQAAQRERGAFMAGVAQSLGAP